VRRVTVGLFIAAVVALDAQQEAPQSPVPKADDTKPEPRTLSVTSGSPPAKPSLLDRSKEASFPTGWGGLVFDFDR